MFNYLYARHVGGKFLLRIEDTDLARSTEESTRSILDGMEWLELEHDEEIVFQSDNADKHRATALKLLEEGKAYRDFTPKAEASDQNVKEGIVERARAAQGVKNMRDNPFRNISEVESDTRAANGEPFAIRLKVAMEGRTAFDDSVYGTQERNYADTEDLVLLRSDGHPLYNLAVVSDDIEMRISHVIRGDDHISNTPKQIALYRALGAMPPVFGHVPMILGPDGKKLSKRHGATAVGDYQHQGILPAAMRNFLALLGWNPGDDREILTSDELVAAFSLEAIQKKAAVFDHVRPLIAPGGTVFGATIAKGQARCGRIAQALMDLHNATGIFSNKTDTADELEAELRARFASVRIWTLGTVALFEARV